MEIKVKSKNIYTEFEKADLYSILYSLCVKAP